MQKEASYASPAPPFLLPLHSDQPMWSRTHQDKLREGSLPHPPSTSEVGSVSTPVKRPGPRPENWRVGRWVSVPQSRAVWLPGPPSQAPHTFL